MNDAKATVAGYAFATMETDPAPADYVYSPSDLKVPTNLARAKVPRWAYQTFDCVRGEPGKELGPADLFVIDGLDAQIGQTEVATYLTWLPAVNAALGRVPLTKKAFWELRLNDGFPLDATNQEPSANSDDHIAWLMCRTWQLFSEIPGFDIARVHKVLHHKRPEQFPLLDRRTRALIRRHRKDRTTALWDVILSDLQANAGQFEELEEWFDLFRVQKGIPSPPGTTPVSLTRLRIHDILIWCKADKRHEEGIPLDWKNAREEGARILAEGGGLRAG
jgi:hypothetical protein